MDDFTTQYDINVRPWRDARANHGRYQDLFDFKKLKPDHTKYRPTKMSPDVDYKNDQNQNEFLDEYEQNPGASLDRSC